MKIYKFVTDSEQYKEYNGLYCTGIIFVPGPYDFYSCIEELIKIYSYKPDYISRVEKHQSEEYFQAELRFMDRPMIYWGPGNHKMVEVFDTKNPIEGQYEQVGYSENEAILSNVKIRLF